jgi:8-oxo-dGTP pyrophosphatase MutT (NUDIX family)
MTDGSANGVIRAAGALVWRSSGQGLEVAVVHRPRYDDWSFPKGKRERGEHVLMTAVREVAEETGVVAELIDKLGDVEYSYERRGRRRNKRVAFYLFEYRSGSLEDHDQEIEEARWMPLEEAARELTHPGEQEIVRRALSRLSPDR